MKYGASLDYHEILASMKDSASEVVKSAIHLVSQSVSQSVCFISSLELVNTGCAKNVYT